MAKLCKATRRHDQIDIVKLCKGMAKQRQNKQRLGHFKKCYAKIRPSYANFKPTYAQLWRDMAKFCKFFQRYCHIYAQVVTTTIHHNTTL